MGECSPGRVLGAAAASMGGLALPNIQLVLQLWVS